MSRFLFTSWPLYGHVLPKLAIASALRDRGNDVAFYAGSQARPLIEAAEPRDVPVRARRRASDRRRGPGAIEERAGMGRPWIGDIRRCFDRCLLEPIPGQVADVSAISQRWMPDAIVCDVSVWGPMVILAETMPIPVALASIFLGPTASSPGRAPRRARPSVLRGGPHAMPSPGRRPGDGRRGAPPPRGRRCAAGGHGLQPMGCWVNDFLGRLPLTLIPSVRESTTTAATSRRGPTTPGRARGSRRTEAGAWENAVPDGRPWVHVAASTVAGGDDGLLRAAVRGLAGRPVELIATAGGGAPGDLGLEPLPANVHLARWVNHARLLPRCGAVVTPGGAGTIVAALTAGVPLVVVPTTWDKPDNARRVVEAGVGVRLSPRRCTPERLRAAVEEVLTCPTYRDRARQFAALMAAAPGPRGAAALLERLASRGAAAEPKEVQV